MTGRRDRVGRADPRNLPRPTLNLIQIVNRTSIIGPVEIIPIWHERRFSDCPNRSRFPIHYATRTSDASDTVVRSIIRFRMSLWGVRVPISYRA